MIIAYLINKWSWFIFIFVQKARWINCLLCTKWQKNHTFSHGRLVSSWGQTPWGQETRGPGSTSQELGGNKAENFSSDVWCFGFYTDKKTEAILRCSILNKPVYFVSFYLSSKEKKCSLKKVINLIYSLSLLMQAFFTILRKLITSCRHYVSTLEPPIGKRLSRFVNGESEWMTSQMKTARIGD